MKLLRLNDLYPFVDTLPNLGDRALQTGFERLLAQKGDTQDSARWKSLPWLTGKAYAASSRPAGDWLKEQYRWTTNAEPLRLAAERAMARVALSLKGSTLMRPVDRIVERHTGYGMVDALTPRLLRRYAADDLQAAIDAADAVLFCAGGLLADHLGNYLPERLFELDLAKRSGKPVVVANYSLALNLDLHLALARAVLPGVDLHVVREPASAERLLELGVEKSSIINSVDSAFALEPMPTTSLESTRRIGLMIRGDRPVDFPAWGRFVNALRTSSGAEVHYLQNCRKYDPQVRRRLAQHCRLNDGGEFLSLKQAREQISCLQLLITDRYHGVVFAVLGGIPVVPIASTTHKTQGLLEALAYPVECQTPLREDSVGDLLTVVQESLRDRDRLAHHMRIVAAKLHQQVFTDYAQLLSRLRVLVARA
jgi:polysaccharide pyruvyl transferase WcaK-like protein